MPVQPPTLTIDPNDIPQPDVYKLLIGSVVPRPIAFVSTISRDGIPNLAPFSFFNAVCSKPPTLLFCPSRRGMDSAKKDTLRNIEETGEFVVNVVTEELVQAMNQTSAEYPADINEFEESGLTPAPSVLIRTPRVSESPINMECRLHQIVEIGDGSVGSGAVVIGTIVKFHFHEDVYANGKILTERLKPVARLAGTNYCPVREIFSVPRPVYQP